MHWNTWRWRSDSLHWQGHWQFQSDLVDPQVLEVMVCSEALSLEADISCDHVVMATDCLTTLKKLHGSYRGVFGAIIQYIRRKM